MSTESTERDESYWDFKQRAGAANILRVAERLGARLERLGESEWTGPCPRCGGTGGFSVDVEKRVFTCRASGASGEVVMMVRHVLALNYAIEAAEWINDPQAARD
jgi:hypothetical protein